MNKNKTILAVVLCLCLLMTTGCGQKNAASVSSASSAESEPQAEQKSVRANPGYNLLTGSPAEGAETLRPVAMMIHNEPGSWPQWGIGQTQVMVEVLSEGKIPSLMCMFDATGVLEPVGPVAPGRDVPWQLAMPSQSILMQNGANPYTYNLLNTWHHQALDGHYVGVTAFDFDGGRDAAGYVNEYCWYTKQELIQNGLDHYGLSNRSEDAHSLFAFAPAAAAPEGAVPASQLRIVFADGWGVELNYQNDAYFKNLPDGQPHQDASTGEQLSFNNVVVLFCSAGVKDDGYTRDYDLTQGTGVYLTQGICLPIQWQKGEPNQPLNLFTLAGEPVQVNPGRTYLAVYGGFAGQEIQVKNGEEVLELPAVPAPLPTPEPTPEPAPEPAPESGAAAEAPSAEAPASAPAEA